MRLDRVTITGADESVRLSDLLALAQEFPFVEWGICASHSAWEAGGRPRYPLPEWIKELQRTSLEAPQPLKLALHLCGRWVRSLLRSEFEIPLWLPAGFQRVQLNFHRESTRIEPEGFAACLRKFHQRDILFQLDGAKGQHYLDLAYAAEADRCYPFFDASGGAGIVPEQWPEPIYMQTDSDHCYHGYAGGLGPDNVIHELRRIASVVGNTRIWIDMETKVRTDNGQGLDLDKVRTVLQLTRPYVDSEVGVQWPRLGPKLWQEDDVNYLDKERLGTAHQRLFGVPYTPGEWKLLADLGDCVFYRTPQAIVQIACDGAAIYAFPEQTP